MTCREMCETIVRAAKKVNPEWDGTALDVWRYSPTGELAMIYAWYDRALEILGETKP